MKLNDLMIRDIRATVDFEDDKVIIRNPKGKVKNELLGFFKDQIDRNMDNSSKTKGRKKKIAADTDILKLLMNKLTNIEIDSEDFVDIVNNPSYELSLVLLYLGSIMQELIFEVMSAHNLQLRMEMNTLLEKDTLRNISKLEDMINEVKHRKLVDESGKEI